MWLAYLTSERGCIKLLKILLIMNLWDAIATSFWVMSGYAIENNPLMSSLIDSSPSAFILLKTSLVTLCIYLLWRLRSVRSSRIFVIPVFILYGYVSLVHISAIFKLFYLW